jgi:uncharacterized membrane protein YeiH
MVWDWLNLIGIIAFASSGAIVAREENYDFLGMLVLGYATSFGGGVLRNILLDQPASILWKQDLLLGTAFFVVVLIYYFPRRLVSSWKKFELIFDAIGLAAFSIQAAVFTTNLGYPLIAVIVSALLTGAGGGIIRDILAGRKPMVFQPGSLYGVWAMGAALIIGLGLPQNIFYLGLLLICISFLRLASVFWNWSLPTRPL